ncbi:hypothetical protein I2I05_19180 [Hymenobacter sp. BT683]|uniref:RiboL-PSP-HEPN domain-containing protein n=1 Tax=Hymenobacter jeongseonensis TaxID=2791027 RepID=A0ABS0IP20_9BACT|nr:MAE_28990/MAE_18760 family HEPN-like nuclease [Hymenobacter jeongseonensis]MBF9239525.1 hypothetical protein [Hymenobacter jeongseonensis]
MLSVGLENLRKNITQLQLIAQVNENIRKHFAEDGDLTQSAIKIGASNYLAAQNILPSQLRWRINDYSAFVTQLYALYETFVFDLIRQWLGSLQRIFPDWNDLPPKVGANYRYGIGGLLQRFGGARTEHLTELSLIEGLYAGLSGNGKYSFISEAFSDGLPNLRHNELISLFAKVGLAEVAPWLNDSSSQLGLMCSAESYSVEGQIKNFISYRNDCAHGPIGVDDLLGMSELLALGDFIFLLCETLVQFVQWNICEQDKSQTFCVHLGNVTEYFKQANALILTTNSNEIKVGEWVAVKSSLRCNYAHVTSLRVNNVTVQTVNPKSGDEVGVMLSNGAKIGAEIFKFNI